MPAEAAAGLAGGFGWLDWGVVLGLLAVTTWVGERKAGRQASVRDFFLGGRRLPWWAVAASIVATEISAVTFISVPFVVARDGGSFTYLQLWVVGALVAKLVVGFVLVPAYYEREIYSPYDYMGGKLGAGVQRTTTALFSLGGVLGQSARVYMTAVVLEVVLARELAWVEAHAGLPPLVTAVAAIGLVALAWTLIGGIATVVWTDAILFLLFLAGIGVALATVAGSLGGGLGEAWRAAGEAGKLRFLDADLDPTKAYTLPAAAVAMSWGMIGPYGTDQLVTQRLFCCASAREARKAMVASYASVLVTLLAGLVGLGLWAYYREHAMSPAAAALYEEKGDRIFPIFVVEVIPAGLKGLVLAGAFAAAISSLDSILAALSQTTLAAFFPSRLREGGGAEATTERGAAREERDSWSDDVPPVGAVSGPADERPPGGPGPSVASDAERDAERDVAAPREVPVAGSPRAARRAHVPEEPPGGARATGRGGVALSRALVVGWGVVLCAAAVWIERVARSYDSILDLALAMASYTGGALISGFALAFLPLKRDGAGYPWGAGLSVLAVFALTAHQPWARRLAVEPATLCAALGVAALVAWTFARALPDLRRGAPGGRVAGQTLALAAGAGLVWWLARDGCFARADGGCDVLAWPWYLPVGSTVAFAWSVLLARPKASGGGA